MPAECEVACTEASPQYLNTTRTNPVILKGVVMDRTGSVVMRRNLFRAGAAFGAAAATWVVSRKAHADNQNLHGQKQGLQNGMGPDGDGPPGLERRQDADSDRDGRERRRDADSDWDGRERRHDADSDWDGRGRRRSAGLDWDVGLDSDDGPPALGGRPTSGNCFLRGTLILTSAGERPVEKLQEGDLLVSRFGGITPILRIVRWHGNVAPVRIKAGTLDGQREDLVLTEHHAVLIDDCLVAVGNLVNGKTIVRELCQAGEYFNIRLESHDVVIAQNAPCESLFFEAEGEEPCLPRYRYRSLRGEATGYLRSAFSPVVDLRNRADVIRDRLDMAA